jgi:hypothetical protein
MGSSRMLQASASMFAGRSFFNHSVSGAGLEDFVLIYYWLRERQLLPSAIVFGVDPWTMSDGVDDPRWPSQWRDYGKAARLIQRDATWAPLERAREWGRSEAELFSPSLFQQAAHEFADSSFRRRGALETTEARDGVKPIKRQDGSMSYSAEMRARSLEDVLRAAREFLKTSPYATRLYDVSGGRVRLLEGLLTQMRRDGVSVTAVELPVSPFVFAAVQRDPARRDRIGRFQAAVGAVVALSGITLIGATDPAALSVRDDDYFDGVHMRPEALAAVLSGQPH